MEAASFTEREIETAMTVTDMSEELGITSQAMTYRVTTPMFKKMVRLVDPREGRRTWHRADFRKYKQACERIDRLRSGQ